MKHLVATLLLTATPALAETFASTPEQAPIPTPRPALAFVVLPDTAPIPTPAVRDIDVVVTDSGKVLLRSAP